MALPGVSGISVVLTNVPYRSGSRSGATLRRRATLRTSTAIRQRNQRSMKTSYRLNDIFYQHAHS